MSRATSHAPRRVVIIGGSLAGMLAAAAVKEHVDSVEILEAHELPAGPEPRTGVPKPPISTGCRPAAQRPSTPCCQAASTC